MSVNLNFEQRFLGGRTHSKRNGLAAMSLAALGIVYGDIGTSPLYAFKVALQASSGTGLSSGAAAVGLASLIIWSLVIVVSLKLRNSNPES